MNTAQALVLSVLITLITGCASNPMLTGKPQHWKGKSVDELRAGLGEPTGIIPQADGGEVWIYSKAGVFLAPAEENTNFGVGGGAGSGAFVASGGIRTTKQEARTLDYENVWRFLIKNGKVRKWYAQRTEGGRVIWEDH